MFVHEHISYYVECLYTNVLALYEHTHTNTNIHTNTILHYPLESRRFGAWATHVVFVYYSLLLYYYLALVIIMYY